MKIHLIVLIFIACFLTGCATMTTTITAPDGTKTVTEQPGSIFGPSSFDVGYTDMFKTFKHEQTKQITAVSDSKDCPKDDRVAQAWCMATGKMTAAVIAMQQFTIKAPTTGFDVIDHNFGFATMGVMGGFQALVAKWGIQGAGSQFGQGATLNNSMNPTQSTALATGNGTSTAPATGTVPQQVTQVPPYIIGPDGNLLGAPIQ